MQRGRGWIPDVIRGNVGTLHLPVGGDGLLPSTDLHLIPYADRVFDQSITNSCVGFAIMTAIYVYLCSKRRQGEPPIELASVLAIYLMARRWFSRATLRDDGCYPRDAIDASTTWGVVPETMHRFDPAHVNDELDLDVIQQAAAYKIETWRRVIPEDGARILEIKRLLHAGYPVIFGLHTDEGFEKYRGGVYERDDDAPSRGGHMLTLLGYETLRDGTTVFYGINSWGITWGERGRFRIGERTIRSEHCTDFYGLCGAPIFAEFGLAT